MNNQNRLPWDKVCEVLNLYLDKTLLLFQKTDTIVAPERRVGGVKIDDKILSAVFFSQDLNWSKAAKALQRQLLATK